MACPAFVSDASDDIFYRDEYEDAVETEVEPFCGTQARTIDQSLVKLFMRDDSKDISTIPLHIYPWVCFHLFFPPLVNPPIYVYLSLSLILKQSGIVEHFFKITNVNKLELLI